MEKAESAPLAKAQPARAKSGRAKPRKKVVKPRVNLAFDRAEVAKMIDQIREEVESRHGCAAEVKAKLGRLTGLEKLLIIKKLLEASRPAAAEKREHPDTRPEPDGAKKILVVDDDLSTLKLISHFLQKEKFRVSTSTSGVEGLKMAFQEAPDLILLDVMMPDLNGFQFLSIYRKVGDNARTPILILSSLSDEADVLRGLEAGAVDYISKPFSPHVLMAKIKKNLNSGP